MTYYLLEYSLDGESWLQGSTERYWSEWGALHNAEARQLTSQGFRIRAFEVQP